MESIKERKEKAMKELREIETLESQHAILNREAEKNELVERLILDLKDQPLACRLPLDTVAKVKMVFNPRSETCTSCYFAETCSQIVNLTGKASAVTRRGKASGEIKKIAIETFKYTVSGDFPAVTVFVTESPLGPERFEVNSNHCKGVRKILTSKYCPHGITGNQISGLTKVLNQKGFVLK